MQKKIEAIVLLLGPPHLPVMEYAALVDLYERLADTDSTNAKRDILAAAFAETEELDRLVTLVRGRLEPAYDQRELGVSSSLTLEAICKATGAAEDDVRERWRETGDLGDAAAWAVEHGGQQTLFSDPLTVERVHDTLREVADYEGSGSESRRVDAVAGLLADADPREARYVVRTALGHLRVGVGEGTIRDAVAAAFLDGGDDAVDAVERAYQVTNDFRTVAATARDQGVDGLEALDIELFRPVQAMLAEKAESLSGALADADAHGRARCEIKYDGIRVQIHVGDEVRLFTRRLEEVTEQFPDVARAVEAGVTADRVLLDGELVGYRPDSIVGERDPVPFQQLSRRVKREDDIAAMAREIPVVVHLFDCLSTGGETLLADPLETRLEALERTYEPVAPAPTEGQAGLEGARAAWVDVPADGNAEDGADQPPDAAKDGADQSPDAAEQLYESALAEGHEGLMVKNPAAPYEPGRRVGRLLKVKPTMEPLDLVVSRAMYSEGRRSDMLGRLYLACYDDGAHELREIGRLSTGYTDEELADLTDRLEATVRSRDGRAVDLRPELVLEVEYEEIQESPEYDSGYALRFPRFLGVREDLDPEDADTLSRVQNLYETQ